MVDALVLFGQGEVDGFGLPWDGPDAFPFAEWSDLARTHGVDSLRAAISATAEKFMFPDRPDVAQRASRELESYTGLDLIAPGTPSNLVKPASISELRAVQAPTLIISGSREMPYLQIVADVLAYGITDAEKVVVPGGGHAVNWEEPERFVAEILRFLRKADAVSDR
jgi:pimeloyl-ACP methyl ester carboxylesterase